VRGKVTSLSAPTKVTIVEPQDNPETVWIVERQETKVGARKARYPLLEAVAAVAAEAAAEGLEARGDEDGNGRVEEGMTREVTGEDAVLERRGSVVGGADNHESAIEGNEMKRKTLEDGDEGDR
jgi:hypothetical protein